MGEDDEPVNGDTVWPTAAPAVAPAAQHWWSAAERSDWWQTRREESAQSDPRARAAPLFRSPAEDGEKSFGGKQRPGAGVKRKDPKLCAYLRKIEFWCAHARTPPSKRGVRLLVVLKGDAVDRMELVEPADVDRADSVA